MASSQRNVLLRRTLYAVLLLLVATASDAHGQDVHDEIRAEVERFVATLNGGDPQALAALYIDSPEVASLGDGQITSGWQPVADLLASLSEQLGPIEMSVDSLNVMELGKDAAIAFFRYRMTMGTDPPQSFVGAMTIVFQRSADGWRVAHDHTSTLPPEAAGTPYSVPLTDSGPPGPVRRTSSCVVRRIVDGDTFECRGVGRVRLIGMDTPEMSQEPYGALASEALRKLTPVGSRVELELDVEPRDQYGRTLAYIWANGLMVNWALVRQGWAVVLTYPPNVQYVDWFSEAQKRAREEGLGLWSVSGFDCAPIDRRRGRCD
jgi:micrococcal nuclease